MERKDQSATSSFEMSSSRSKAGDNSKTKGRVSVKPRLINCSIVVSGGHSGLEIKTAGRWREGLERRKDLKGLRENWVRYLGKI